MNHTDIELIVNEPLIKYFSILEWYKQMVLMSKKINYTSGYYTQRNDHTLYMMWVMCVSPCITSLSVVHRHLRIMLDLIVKDIWEVNHIQDLTNSRLDYIVSQCIKRDLSMNNIHVVQSPFFKYDFNSKKLIALL